MVGVDVDGPRTISTREELDAALGVLRERGGDPEAFERDLLALAPSVVRPVGATALLRMARLGWEAYAAPAPVPSAEPVRFLGRPQQPSAPREPGRGGPRTAPDPGETQWRYLRYLADDVRAFAARCGEPLSGVVAESVGVYVALLGRDDFREVLGWSRSQDAHALAALVHDRTARVFGVGALEPAVEQLLFRWLHLATHAEVTPDDLAEQATRRELRTAHEALPAHEVAVMTCEVPIAGLPIDELCDRVLQTGLPVQALTGAGDAGDAGDAERLDLTALVEDAPGADLATLDKRLWNHLLRWLSDRDVAVTALRLAIARDYAHEVLRDLGRRHTDLSMHPVLHAHFVAMLMLRRELPVGLPDELALLAWACDQVPLGLALHPFLGARAAMLA